MLENKFDLDTVEKYEKDLNDLFTMADEILHGIGMNYIEKKDYELLLSSYDCVIRLSGMYNDIIKQLIDGNSIAQSDPQKYISSNLNSAINLTKMFYDKYKVHSRYSR